MSDKPSVVEAISAVMAQVQAVGKAGRNAQQGYSFRGVDAVVNAVGPALREHGVVVVPQASRAVYRDVEVGQKRTPMREATVTVTYRFYGPAGDYLDAEVPGEAMDSGDKATPKAMSVAYRIVLLQALAIPTGDVDPDAQSYERAPEPPPQVDTDPEWLHQMEVLADESTTQDALRAVWETVTAEHKAARVSDTDCEALVARIVARKHVLDGVA